MRYIYRPLEEHIDPDTPYLVLKNPLRNLGKNFVKR